VKQLLLQVPHSSVALMLRQNSWPECQSGLIVRQEQTPAAPPAWTSEVQLDGLLNCPLVFFLPWMKQVSQDQAAALGGE
jgi:hypothetical protein